jgi:hypothetical protein
VVSTLPRSAAACREPFDQSFHVVGRRADLSADARLLHAYLVSLYRTGRELTQAAMAAEVGLTRHRVWAALRSLVAAGLLESVRVGLGRPNRYRLMGLPETAVRPVRRQHAGQAGNPARGYVVPPKRTERTGYIQPPRSGSLMQTRYGRYVRPDRW